MSDYVEVTPYTPLEDRIITFNNRERGNGLYPFLWTLVSFLCLYCYGSLFMLELRRTEIEPELVRNLK